MSDRPTRSVTMTGQEPLSDAAPLSRSAVLTKSDSNISVCGLRQRSSNKITGRRLRQPRKFVVTDVPDHDEMFSTPTASPSKLVAADSLRVGEEIARAPCVPTMSRRKGKMEVKGRFTIIDWSPDSPAASPFHHELNVSASKIDSPRKRMLRKQLSSGSKHGSAAGPTASQQTISAINYARERRMLSLNAPSTSAAPPTPRANLHMFDNHLAFLEKESTDMKSTLESMVNTNAQWIEMLAKSGLNLSPECTSFQASESSTVDPTVVAPVVATAAPSNLAASIRRPSFDAKYHTLEMAYMELQKKYENALRDNERMEIKNIMLETRLQQQVTRAESLRAQLEKLTRYTENLIGDYSEPNYTGYGSDLNSLFGEQSSVEVDEASPTAVEMSSEYDFNYEALKDQEHASSLRPRRRSDEEECISDTSSEQDMSSGCEFVDNNRQFGDAFFCFDDDTPRPAGLTTADLSSLPAVMVDPGALLGESKTNTSSSSDDDMMAPLSSPDDNQRTHEFPEPHGLSKVKALKRQGSSFTSMNMSTVSSTSSLASFGAQVAALSRSKDGSFTDLLAAAIAKQRHELIDIARSSEC